MAIILVAGEHGPSGVSSATLELISAARQIAGQGGEVVATFTGQPGTAVGDVPADRVYLIEDDALGAEDMGVFDAATAAYHQLANETAPAAVLFARSDSGSVIAPRLAHRLGSALAQDSASVEMSEDGSLTVSRPVYGGNAIGRFRSTGPGPHVAIIRQGAYDPAPATGSSPEPVKFDVSLPAPTGRPVLIDTVQEQRQGVRLEDTEVVVSGGRGLGGPEPFAQLQELADLLGGAVGASRAACDAGWIDHSHQVGLTGKSISPRLYLTFGISGASQHMAGCSAARNIVAVNKDGDANIFSEARFGVVGDWSKVLPAFIETLRDLG